MDLYHWPSPEGNFGDDLNLWLWDFLLPGFRATDTKDLLVGVGTVLDTALLPLDRRKVVVGSGTGYGKTPDVSDASLWDIRCVRGPLTAKVLGLAPDKGIIDPAAIIPDMDAFQGLASQKYGTVFVPHWESALFGRWERVCEEAGITYVDSCGDAHEVISMIAQSTLVIAESMHAAILADAFRVPWIPVSTSKQINPFKWTDWASSLELAYKPIVLPLSSPLEAGAKGQPYLGLRWPKGGSPEPMTPGAERQGRESLGGERVEGSLKSLLKSYLASSPVSGILMKPAVYHLKKALNEAPQLSDSAVYLRQKARFYDVIEQLKSDYCL